MDNFTRNYSLLLGAVLVAALFFWGQSLTGSSGAGNLDDVLTADAMLAKYPYQFRVRAFNDGVAVISTPRSPDFPAYSFLQVIYPKLVGKAQDDPEIVAAQQALIDHQKRAMGLILAQPGVTSVNWELDVQWLAEHGVHR